MAFIQNNQNDEDEDQVDQPGQSSGESGIITAGSTAPSSAKGTPNKTQSFATLQNYLKPNQAQGEALAGQIASNTAQVGEAAKTSVNQAADTIGGKISQNTYKPELINEALSNPSSFVKDQTKVDEFNKQRTAQYQGPNSFEENPEAADATHKVANAVEKSKLLDSEAGQKQLLSDVQQNKAGGITALNQALLSTNPNAAGKLQEAKGSFAGLEDMLTTKKDTINSQITASKQAASQARADAQSRIDAKVAEFSKGLTDRTTDVRTQLDTLAKSATAKLQNGQALTQDELKALNTTEEIMAEVRKQQDILRRHYGSDFNIGSYATTQAADTVIQPHNLASEEDYETERALELLAGNELPYLQESQRGQAGSAPKSLVDFKGNQAKDEATQQINSRDNAGLDQLRTTNWDLGNKIDNRSPFGHQDGPRFAYTINNAAKAGPDRLAQVLGQIGQRQGGAVPTAKLLLASDRQGRFNFNSIGWGDDTGLNPDTRAMLESMVG